jgi:putative phosphoesterase
MEVVVLADTHLRGGAASRLPAELIGALARADVVLHAGDVVTPEALDELSALARPAVVHAVLGNNDHQLVGVLPTELVLDLAGVAVALLHDSGPTAGREGRLHRRFPTAALVVFGHSHAPLDAPGLGGQRLFNPGSPTQRRAQPNPSFGRLRLAGGRVVDHAVVPLPRP